LFKKIIRSVGFDDQHFVPVDIRGADNDEILKRLKEAIESILKKVEAKSESVSKG